MERSTILNNNVIANTITYEYQNVFDIIPLFTPNSSNRGDTRGYGMDRSSQCWISGMIGCTSAALLKTPNM